MSPTPSELEALASTRSAWHSLAEHVLAVDLHRATGKIGLRPLPGGFGQPEYFAAATGAADAGPGQRRRLRVDGDHLVILSGDAERWHPLTTLGAALELAGLEPGAATGAFEATSRSGADLDVSVDPIAARSLADWFTFVSAALEVLRRRHAETLPSIVQLWPEHFDAACSFAEINFGGSPGDAGRPEPYLYVGPWSAIGDDPFWNESYGAARSRSDVAGLEEAVGFFEEGLERSISQR